MFNKKKDEDAKPEGDVKKPEPEAKEPAGVTEADTTKPEKTEPVVEQDNKVDTAPKKEAAKKKQPAPKKPGAFKDKPRPMAIFRDEAAKTGEVKKEVAAKRKIVDDKLQGLQGKYAPTLEDYDKQLKAAGESRVKVRRDTVEKLTTEVDTTKKHIADLEKQLKEARARLSRSQKDLGTASKELKTETKKVEKENKAAYKQKKQELSGEISEAKKERSKVYGETGKKLRGERWNTAARTTKETAAVVPDLCVRFAKAVKNGTVEVFKAPVRMAQGMKKGFDEPTTFSIERDKPIVKPKPKKEKKAKAKKQPAPKK